MADLKLQEKILHSVCDFLHCPDCSEIIFYDNVDLCKKVGCFFKCDSCRSCFKIIEHLQIKNDNGFINDFIRLSKE